MFYSMINIAGSCTKKAFICKNLPISILAQSVSPKKHALRYICFLYLIELLGYKLCNVIISFDKLL